MWANKCSHIKVSKKGNEFCNYCTSEQDEIPRLEDEWVKLSRTATLKWHQDIAKAEFYRYRQCQKAAIESTDFIHLVFDFAEKILLLFLLHQPGQLNFKTGGKFDTFGVSCSNTKDNYIYSLAEEFWPEKDKSSNVVISMLHQALETIKEPGTALAGTWKLILHADNCAAKNKNKYVFRYLAWRVLAGYDDEISLHFLVAGHTKNVVDGAFGSFKRKVRNMKVVHPADAMYALKNSSESTIPVLASAVRWTSWKKLLRDAKEPARFLETLLLQT